jgi:DNA-binding transcriptional regulator YiaG
MAIQTKEKVPTLDKSLSQLLNLPEDIRLIQEREGLSCGQLAQRLGVSKTEVWHWGKGHRLPKEPLVLLSLLSWAEELRATPPN